MRIGLHKANYSVDRAICGDAPPSGHEFVKVISVSPGALPGTQQWRDWVRYFNPLARVDLIHTFNYLVLNHRPWVVSFESYLPRFMGGLGLGDKRAWTWGLDRLASRDCLAILPLSQAARNLFFTQAAKNGFCASVFQHKVEVVYPAVRQPRLRPVQERSASSPFTILFVGNEFFRKGGRTLLRAFKAIAPDVPVRLEIVSSMQGADFVTHADTAEVARVRAELAMTPHVTWHEHISTSELVNRWYPAADVFVLPTLSDSFGYAVIEAMACGLPVISTNQFAGPEQVTHGRNGYLIELPLDETRRLACLQEPDLARRARQLEAIEDSMTQQLEQHLRLLIANPKLRRRQQEESLAIYHERFSPSVRNATLEGIYDRIGDGNRN